MKTKLTIALLAFLIGAITAHYVRKEPEVRIEERVVEKEKVVTRTVRVTQPDGTVTETIDKSEDRQSEAAKVTQVNKRRYFIGVSKDVYGSERGGLYQIDMGYRVFGNVALKASYVRYDDDQVALLGLQVDF